MWQRVEILHDDLNGDRAEFVWTALVFRLSDRSDIWLTACRVCVCIWQCSQGVSVDFTGCNSLSPSEKTSLFLYMLFCNGYHLLRNLKKKIRLLSHF